MIEDLPVAVSLPAPLGAQVSRWVERDLGWQVVDGGGPLAAVVALADGPCDDLPWIAVCEGAPDGEQVRRHLTAGALDVVAWPHDRLRIPLLAARVERGRGAAPRHSRVLVAGAAGGCGTSTVVLAIAGVLAWSGAAVLACGSRDLLALAGAAGGDRSGGAVVAPRGAAGGPAGSAMQGAAGSVPPALVGTPARSAPSPVPGVRGLSVVADEVAAAAWAGDVVVVDGGTEVTAETTLVVSRPDRGLRRAHASGRPVLVIGDQPLGARACRRALGPALVGCLPLSARVARAGLGGHVPAALPGTWLRDLRAALARLERAGRGQVRA